MRYVKSTEEDVRKALEEALLVRQDWIICVSAYEPDDPGSYVLENVTRYETEGHFASLMGNPVFIEYGISVAQKGAQYPYRIHDSLMTPVFNKRMFISLVDSMVKTFDVFIIEEDMVDRYNVYGKLSSDHSEEIVFINEFN